MDWNNPIKGQSVPSLTEAQDQMGFAIYAPKNLGPVKDLLVSQGDIKHRVLAMIFDTTTFGRVVVIEEMLRITLLDYEAGLKEVAEASESQPGLAGNSRLETIRDGKLALVTEAEDGSVADIRWTDGTTVFLIRGPVLVAAAAIEIAEGL